MKTLVKFKKVLNKLYFKSALYFFNTEKIFNRIYDSNHWSSPESISGKGSEVEQTQEIINKLPYIFKKYEIKSILDIPCGDFNWMRFVNLNEINYLGADIVEKIISNNQSFAGSNLNFKKLNILEDELPKVDLIFCRDCLVHFSNSDINKAITNIKRSGSKYLLTTSFNERLQNKNIITGKWRPLNLEISPFNFELPIDKIKENCTEGNGAYSDKCLILWEVDKLLN